MRGSAIDGGFFRPRYVASKTQLLVILVNAQKHSCC